MDQVAASTPVDVSVLVPVLNEGATIVQVVRAMTAQRFDGTVEFLFADGGSSDDTKSRLLDLGREDPRIRVFDNPLRKVASGLNVCLREARGTYVARMDGHALYPPTYLRDGVQRLNAAPACPREPGSGREPRSGSEPAVAWVAGPQVPVPRGRFAAAVTAALGTRLGQGGSRRWGGAGRDAVGRAVGEYELDTGVFCGVWLREDVLAKGGWDEAWVVNEDSELASRFIDAGQRIVCLPEMAAGYFPRSSPAALFRQYRVYGVYRAKTALRHQQSLRRSAVLPPLLVLDLAAALLASGSLGWVGRLARLGLRLYGVALLAASVEAARRPAGKTESERLLVPVAIATMHLAHGSGFLEGCAKWGVPWRALGRALGLPIRVEPYRGPIDDRSL